tara:strand:+ start:1419 stop:2033 length:615 start_codon:yes stop_codon:yes gene_type:complete
MSSYSNSFHLKEGDILFQDLDSSPLCEAIETVTPGFKNASLSHIGMIVSHNNELKVIEALPPEVVFTNIEDFLSRSLDCNNNPKVIVGRLKYKYSNIIPKAIKYAKNQVGTKYDDAFLMNNDLYYCSELIHDSFREDSIFQLRPMTFVNPKTNKTLEIWEKYYSDLGIDIPQNEPGINPGQISLSNKLDIIHFYGVPDGMKTQN